jgi:DNA-binding NarL/FixJ family response regulator
MISILLADDHKQVRKALRATLEDCDGWHVCGEAGDGREAVRLACELKPDVAVLDYSMPGLNGVEATRQIKKVLPDVEVLILTMYDSDALRTSAREAGARGFVPKSNDEFQIINAIRIVLKDKASGV